MAGKREQELQRAEDRLFDLQLCCRDCQAASTWEADDCAECGVAAERERLEAKIEHLREAQIEEIKLYLAALALDCEECSVWNNPAWECWRCPLPGESERLLAELHRLRRQQRAAAGGQAGGGNGDGC